MCVNLFQILKWHELNHLTPLLVQPENPAQLGGKIYEMMGMALSGKWSGAQSQPLEAEVVEPVEADSQK